MKANSGNTFLRKNKEAFVHNATSMIFILCEAFITQSINYIGALSTRGGQKLKSKKRHPTIEDNVTIYSGASILGGETVVGKNVVVGRNAFITKSIPDGAKVSIKNQELRYNYDTANPIQRAELEQDESWFYVI